MKQDVPIPDLPLRNCFYILINHTCFPIPFDEAIVKRRKFCAHAQTDGMASLQRLRKISLLTFVIFARLGRMRPREFFPRVIFQP